ncbi:DUF58 domain-containing protein [Microbacterium sp. P04]|uniref:DUF58 domain-containing protein n=1 Tax=Microbacterium sp. P04 TaxID=3366947 RepID=UPI0037451B04
MIGALQRNWPLTARGTGALVLAVACFVVAHAAGLVELVYFGVLLVGALLAGFVSLWLTRRIDAVTRSLTPDVATVDRESIVTVRVALRSALPAAASTWTDAVSAGLDGVGRGVFPALGSGLRGEERTIDLRYGVIGRTRGIHALGPFALTATDPFGLARRRVRRGGKTPVTVAPAVLELTSVPATAGEAGGMLQTVTAQPGQGADNLVARPYAPGDSMRRIHWRATAHRDTLMVRQEEQEASPGATVVLDRGAARWGADATRAPGLDPDFETAVSIAVSAAARLVRDGYAVDILDTDGTALAERILGGEVHEIDALATQFATLIARAGDGLARTAGMFAGTQAGPVFVVTGRVDLAEIDALAPLTHHSSFPVLLSTRPAPGVVARAVGHGWHAAAVPADSDISEGWAAALERSAGHGFA